MLVHTLSLAALVLPIALSAPVLPVAPTSTTSSGISNNPSAAQVSPVAVPPPSPLILALSNFTALFNSAPLPSRRDLSDEVEDLLIFDQAEAGGEYDESRVLGKRAVKKDFLTRQAQIQAQRAIGDSCVGPDSSTLPIDYYISSLFYYGGAGTTVWLCQYAFINLTNPIWFFNSNQTLATVGLPSGPARATLTVTGVNQSCAIYGQGQIWANNIALRNVQIDGGRPALGIIPYGVGNLALIEMGGINTGHTIDSVNAFEPRGWSTLHGIEGTLLSCKGMVVTNNQFGPAGHAPSGSLQFRKRDNTGTYTAGQWADGISMACQGSTVANNVITDATDGEPSDLLVWSALTRRNPTGGIVIFGAPGSQVTGNTVKSVNRQLMGGINMVDWGPFSGSFTGTVVSGNTIFAQGNFIKIGVAIGGMVWGVDNRTIARTYGGTVQNNIFRSGASGYFGYSIGIAGHANATISGNDATAANFGSILSPNCYNFPLPTPQSFVADEWTTPGSSLQPNFFMSTLALLICRGPGPIIARFGLGATK
ncbi:hypothetical protein P7C70_g5853, partial [Phenoliferia sp. Uapishka_3]